MMPRHILPFQQLAARELAIRGVDALDDWYEKHVGYRPSEEIGEMMDFDAYTQDVAEMMSYHVGDPGFEAKARRREVIMGPCAWNGTQFLTGTIHPIVRRDGTDAWRWLARDPDTGTIEFGIECPDLWDVRELAQGWCSKACPRSHAD